MFPIPITNFATTEAIYSGDLEYLVSWWKCEENAANGTVADSQGSNTGTAYDGSSTCNTSALTTTGKINNGFFPTSTNEYNVNCGTDSSLYPTGEMSVCFWIKQPSTASHDGAALFWEAYTNCLIVSLPDPTKTRVTYYRNGVPSNYVVWEENAISQDAWHQIVLSVPARATQAVTNIKCYVDGVAWTIVSSVATGAVDTSSPGFLIGSPDESYYVSYPMDEVRFYSKCLDVQDDIDWLYNSGSGQTIALPAAPL